MLLSEELSCEYSRDENAITHWKRDIKETSERRTDGDSEDEEGNL